MKVVMVMVILAHGHMSLSEIGPYNTIEECRSEFYRLIDKYVADGAELSDLNGGCYYKPKDGPR